MPTRGSFSEKTPTPQVVSWGWDPWFFISLDRAIQYQFFEYFNQHMNPYLSGVLCGCLSNVYQIPMQQLQNNYIMDKSQHKIFPFVRDVYRNHGILGFYRGFKMEVVRVPLSCCLFLGTYGNLRSFFGPSAFGYAASASLAGFVLWSITFPLDLLRTVSQTTAKRTSYWTIFKHRVHMYGVRNLWKGVLPVFLRTLPSYALSMLAYEHVRDWVGS